MADLSRQRQTEREREELLVSAHPRPRIRVWARQGRDGLWLGYGWAWVAQFLKLNPKSTEFRNLSKLQQDINFSEVEYCAQPKGWVMLGFT